MGCILQLYSLIIVFMASCSSQRSLQPLIQAGQNSYTFGVACEICFPFLFLLFSPSPFPFFNMFFTWEQ